MITKVRSAFCLALFVVACSSRNVSIMHLDCYRPPQRPSVVRLVPDTIAAEQALQIRATDVTNDTPLAHVQIAILPDTTSKATTDQNGLATISWPHAQPRQFRVRRIGYAAIDTVLQIPNPRAVRALLQLEPAPVTLCP